MEKRRPFQKRGGFEKRFSTDLTFFGMISILVGTIIVDTIMKLEDELKGKFKNPHDKARLNIIYTGAWIIDDLNNFLKPFGLSEPQYNVLRVLRPQTGKPVNLNYLHERMVHKSCNTTRLVQKLVEKDLVLRKQNELNRRQIEISITKKGLHLLDKIYLAIKPTRNEFQKKITRKEAEFLADILDRIRE